MMKYPRRIFVAVVGMTPQVVTETLYALLQAKGEAPTEIHLITTSNGRNRAVRDLLDSQTGQFHAFCRDFSLCGQIKFDASMIHVIHDAEGAEIPDIRTPEENTAAADLIVGLIRSFAQDDKAQIWVSLAGGRKTMSFFIGYALSLFGREQDSLSHVLVSEPFENNRDFFYPSQSPKTIFSPAGEPLDVSTAKVMLADIPLIRLRSGLPDALVTGQAGYGETVQAAQSEVVPVHSLSFVAAERTVICGTTPVKLAPALFAVLWWFAERRWRRLEPVRAGENAQAEEFLKIYRRVVSTGSAEYEAACKTVKTPEYFLKYIQEKGGSWMGGGGNMLAIQAALDVDEATMAYALVMDSICATLYVMFLLWAIGNHEKFNKWTKADTSIIDGVGAALEEEAKANTKPLVWQNIILLLGSGLLVSAVSMELGSMINAHLSFFDSTTWTVLIVSVLGIVFALTPFGKIKGTEEISNVMLYIVIALIASRADLGAVGNAPIWLLAGFVILLIHVAIMIALAKILKLDIFTCSVASLANIGGTATAPVLAGAYSNALVPVGIMMALLGYVIGTGGGLVVANLMSIFG